MTQIKAKQFELCMDQLNILRFLKFLQLK